MSDQPALPYAGTSGWSGSETSRERAERDDYDGTTSARQSKVIFALANEGVFGMTVREVRAKFGWHHGQASGVLSVLHKVGAIDRLVERRDRCAVYVLPQFRLGRDAVSQGRKPRAEDEADLIRDAYDEGRRDGRADAFETDAYKALIAESTLLRAAATERHATEAILTDLIAELRHRHTPYRVCMECDDWHSGCEDHEQIVVCLWCCTSHGYHSMDCADNHTGTTLAEHCVTIEITDRAEARLREVTGDE